MPPDYFDMEAILDIHCCGNTMQYLIKRVSYPDSFNYWEIKVVQINDDSVTPKQHHSGQLLRGTQSFITPQDGESCTCPLQLHGFHTAQQCRLGAVPQKHQHGLQGGAARARPAAWQWLRSRPWPASLIHAVTDDKLYHPRFNNRMNKFSLVHVTPAHKQQKWYRVHKFW